MKEEEKYRTASPIPLKILKTLKIAPASFIARPYYSLEILETSTVIFEGQSLCLTAFA